MFEMDILGIGIHASVLQIIFNRVLNSGACMVVASVLCTRTGHMRSAMFLKGNHDNTKTSKIGIKMVMDSAVAARQVCYLRRKLLSSQLFGPTPLVCHRSRMGWQSQA